jgi:three-Cys-motif partner protein
MGKSDGFFKKQTLQSRIKTEIVTKYFSAWWSIMAGHLTKFWKDRRIAYYDFFSGQGIYDDGTKSTPILILEEAVGNDYLRNNLITKFVDSNLEHCRLLNEAIFSIPNITELNFEPKVHKISVSDPLIEKLESYSKMPKLVFIDPWGYKGLSSRLIDAVIKDWGCDCIFLFNYDSINRWLTNPNVTLLGDDRLKKLQTSAENIKSYEREEKIMRELEHALYENRCKYVLKFCFKKGSGKRTSHYIVFVTKHIKGYNEMKKIMVKVSSDDLSGEPTFEYNPFLENGIYKFLETDSTKPSRRLQELLLKDFAGKTITFGEIFGKREHHVGKPYTEKHYRYALIGLKEEGIISVERNFRKGTFPKEVLITFPPKKE